MMLSWCDCGVILACVQRGDYLALYVVYIAGGVVPGEAWLGDWLGYLGRPGWVAGLGC